MKFQPGQHVINNGTLYIFRHDSTMHGEPPRVQANGKRSYCSYAVVNLPNSTHPIIMHRSSLQAVADTIAPPIPSPPTPVVDSHKPTRADALSLLKADALDAQAERLESYARSLRTEARSLRWEA